MVGKSDETNEMKKCKYCGSKKIIKYGMHINRRGEFQKYKCQNCGRIRIGKKLIIRQPPIPIEEEASWAVD